MTWWMAVGGYVVVMVCVWLVLLWATTRKDVRAGHASPNDDDLGFIASVGALWPLAMIVGLGLGVRVLFESLHRAMFNRQARRMRERRAREEEARKVQWTTGRER